MNCSDFYDANCISVSIFNDDNSVKKVKQMIDEDFNNLLSFNCRELIKEYSTYRYDTIKQTFNIFAL